MSLTGGQNSTPLTEFTSPTYHPCTSRLLKAIEQRSIEAVQTFISNGVPVNALGGVFNESPLHISAQQGWTDGVELLLSSGADAYSKNHYDQTPLHYACASKSHLCVRLLLDAGCQEAIHQHDKRGRTPLHDAASQSCDNCVTLLIQAGAVIDARDNHDETPLHKAAKSNATSIMLLLLNKGADLGAKDKQGESPLSYMLRNSPDQLDTLLDNCLITNSAKIAYKKLEIILNFLPISGTPENNQVKNLHDVVELGHPKHLLHPLCESYLLLKWTNVRRYFFFEVIFYFVYAILATGLTVDKFVLDVCDSKSLINSLNLGDNVFISLTVIVIIQAIIILLKECLMMFLDIRTWIYSMWHVSNCVISILVMIVLFSNKSSSFGHHASTILVLMLWVQCMLHISRFPSCGIYVAMFAKVAMVFMRIFSIFFCLLLAFTMSFYVSKYQGEYKSDDDSSINNEEIKVDNSAESEVKQCLKNMTVYSDPIYTFFKTVTMMIGELDFDDELIAEMEILPGTSHLIYLGFVILVSIILSNLLVALAVNDVQALRNCAYLERLIKQMELVYQMEKTYAALQFIAEYLHLSRFHKTTKTLMSNFLRAKVTLEPYHPQKGTRFLISRKGENKEVTIKKSLVTSIINCLKSKSAHAVPGNKKMSIIRRGSRQPTSGSEGVQELIKNLDSFITDLSNRMEDMMTLCGSMNARLQSVENSILDIGGPCRHASFSHTNDSLERDPIIVSPRDRLTLRHSSDLEFNV